MCVRENWRQPNLCMRSEYRPFKQSSSKGKFTGKRKLSRASSVIICVQFSFAFQHLQPWGMCSSSALPMVRHDQCLICPTTHGDCTAWSCPRQSYPKRNQPLICWVDKENYFSVSWRYHNLYTAFEYRRFQAVKLKGAAVIDKSIGKRKLSKSFSSLTLRAILNRHWEKRDLFIPRPRYSSTHFDLVFG